MSRVGALAVVLGALFAAATGSAADLPQAPPIAGPTVTGGAVSLTELRGKPVFVNVWSSW